MKLKQTTPGNGERRIRAVDVVKAPESEAGFSVRTFFTPEEWAKVRKGVFRENKDYGYVADRYFLSQISDEQADQFQTEEKEALFQTGDSWINQVVDNGKIREITSQNLHQALHCSAIVAGAFPDQRTQLSAAPQIQEFIHKAPGFLFNIDRLHKKAVGIRILLRGVIDYLTLFPDERAWAMKKLDEKELYELAQRSLEELAATADWFEYLHLGSQMRLLFPDFTVSHVQEMATYLSQQKHSSRGFLYTMLPELLELKIMAAEQAELSAGGVIHIQDRISKLTTKKSLPDRLVA